MKLFEMYGRSPEGYQDLAADNSRPKLGELRKTKLTLRQINKLRKMQEVREYERNEKLSKIRRQYSPPVEPGSLPGGF
jgi:hypothetical protein